MIIRKEYFPFLLLMSLMLSGCELLGPKSHEKLVIEPADQHTDEQAEVIYQELSNEAMMDSATARAKIELYPGTGQFVSRKSRPRSGKPAGHGEYSLNFDDADLGEVAKVILSDILGENYLLSPKVTGRVTLQTTHPLSRSELLPTLDMVLQINNAAMVFQDGLYQIKPKTEALSSSAFNTFNKYRNKLAAGYQIKVVPVRNVAVEELAEIIKPLMQEKAILHVDSNRNMLLVAGTPGEIARTMDMVETFDVDIMKGRSFGLFPLRNVEAKTIIEELRRVFNGSTEKTGKSFFQFMEIERLNAILAITQQPKYLKEIERWVLRLDKANTSAGGGVNVYRVQHVDAVGLASTLNEIFSGNTRKDRPASVASGRKTVEVSNKKQAGKNKIRSAAHIAATLIGDVGDVKIIADEINNALIVVATAQDYAVVHRVIKQLDVMPLQVLIDATIVEVTLTDELKYGIQWFLSHQNGGQHAAGSLPTLSSGGVDLTKTVSNLALGAATGGFGYAFTSNSGDISAVLSAAATDNKINVISSPSLMVLNNQEATMQVGDEVPIRTTESTNTNDATNPIQTSSIQQRKTGVKLKVKPRVNANGLVIMDIEQSVENVADSKVSGSNIDSPTISTREFTSSVAVQSGETVILGGLIKDDDTFNKGGIPVLHELPLIGPLFGSTTKKNIKTELVVLITPRVVKSRLEARLITNEFKRKLTGIYVETGEAVNPESGVKQAGEKKRVK